MTLGLGAALLLSLGLLVRSLFRQAGIQDAMKETSDTASDQMKLWEEFGQHLDIAVALVNDKQEIAYANGTFAEMTGWPGRAAFNQQLDTILHLQDAAAQPTKLPTGLRGAQVFVISKDGRRTAVQATRQELHRPTGFVVVVLRDATAEVAEREIRHRLINLSSFELRAPITAMKGYASMLLEGDAGKLPKEVEGYVKPIVESSDKLLTIIDDMAHVEELSSKKADTHKSSVAVADYVKEIAPRLREVATTAGRDLQVSEGSFEARLSIDKQQVARLLAMLTNTAARTSRSKSDISLSVHESPRTIDFHLENVGDPLPKQSQANVFDYVGGHGLDEGIGFYVAKQIIEAHHAYVTVNTRPDGNLFVLSIPKLEGPHAASAGTEAQVRAPKSASAPTTKPSVDGVSKNAKKS